MTGVLLAPSRLAPQLVGLPDQVSPWTSCVHRWTCDGQTWDLTGIDDGLSSSGVFLLPGTRGYQTMPPTTTYKGPSATGARWRGFKIEERETFWNLEVYGNGGSQAWIDYLRDFARTLRPDKVGVWSVTQPGDGLTAGQTRHLTQRYARMDDDQGNIASELLGWADYGIYFGTGQQPYWRGEEILQSWNNAGGLVNYYGGGPADQLGAGPPFVTTSGRAMATAKVNNPGEISALPVWTEFGPATTATFGIGDKLITVPFALTAGQWVRIDTSSSDRRAMFGSGAVQDETGRWLLPPGAEATGVNRTRDLGAATRFGEVPAGESVPLSIAMTGLGQIDMSLTPLYWMAR